MSKTIFADLTDDIVIKTNNDHHYFINSQGIERQYPVYKLYGDNNLTFYIDYEFKCCFADITNFFDNRQAIIYAIDIFNDKTTIIVPTKNVGNTSIDYDIPLSFFIPDVYAKTIDPNVFINKINKLLKMKSFL